MHTFVEVVVGSLKFKEIGLQTYLIMLLRDLFLMLILVSVVFTGMSIFIFVNTIEKMPGDKLLIKAGKFVAEHPTLTFGTIGSTKVDYETYTYLNTTKEQIVINKNEAFKELEKQTEAKIQELLSQGYNVKEESGKIIGTKYVLVHTEDLNKIYNEQNETIRQTINNYISKGYKIKEETSEKIVLEGEKDIITIDKKGIFENLRKAIEDYKKKLESKGFKVEEKNGKLYIYGEEKIIYDVESKRIEKQVFKVKEKDGKIYVYVEEEVIFDVGAKRKELEDYYNKLIEEYKSQGYNVREENGKIIAEKPYSLQEIIEKVGAEVLKDIAVFIGLILGIKKGIKYFFKTKK